MAKTRTNYLARELADHRASEFIEDGAKEFIVCSACGKQLIEIWMVRPKAPLTTYITVDCPFCGDKSFKKTIRGQYCLGHLESRTVVMVDTPTKVETTPEGALLQKVHVKTEKGEV